MALANLPMVPNVIPPTEESQRKEPPQALAAIHYMVTPTIDPKTLLAILTINGSEVLSGPG